MSDEPETQRIPVVEETARISKEEFVTGKVIVRTISDEIQQTIREELGREEVEVTRVPIGREVDAPPAVRTLDGVMIVPVLEERLVIEKRLVLAEELHIRKRTASETVEVPVTLRKQRAEVERVDAPDRRSPKPQT